jgi:hypothetical protein
MVKEGNIDGQGTCIYKNGDRYEGDFSNGKQAGKGVYKFANGNRCFLKWIP